MRFAAESGFNIAPADHEPLAECDRTISQADEPHRDMGIQLRALDKRLGSPVLIPIIKFIFRQPPRKKAGRYEARVLSSPEPMVAISDRGLFYCGEGARESCVSVSFCKHQRAWRDAGEG